MNVSRRKIVAVVSPVLVLAAFGSLWLASSTSTSPEQRIADADPPPPPVVAVEVEKRQLVDIVAVRGTVTAVGSRSIPVPEVSAGAPVVVDLPVTVGAEVKPGQVIAVVADRPVIALPMTVPPYRTLTPGIVGNDVARFQEALRSLGYDIDADGRFGSSTQALVRRLYEERGHSAAPTSDEASAALDAAQEAVVGAQDALDDARRARDQARTPLPASDEEPTPQVDQSAADDAERAVARAERSLNDAVAARDEADSRVGVQVPIGEVTALSFPAIVASVDTSVGAVAEGSLMRITTSDLVFDATVDPSVAGLLVPGVSATADDWDLEVESNTRTTDAGQTIVRFRSLAPVPSEAIGQEVRIDAELAATDGPVLAVPISAVRSTADSPVVRVIGRDGEVRLVPVETGASIGGWVEITESEEPLEAGTQVRIG